MDVIKTCNDNGQSLNDEALAKKNDEEKCIVDSGSFFDCRICLDVAKDPVLTCCGHLFCWPCLYRWLHVQSVAKECPVCKGEVTIKNLTPIIGRRVNVQKPEINYTSLKIPLRPQARRVESWRQAIRKEAFTVPLEEMVGRLGRKFDVSRVHLDNDATPQESPESSSSLLNRLLTSRGMRREQNNIISPNYVEYLTESSPVNIEVGESRGNSSPLLHRLDSNEAAIISHLTSSLDSTERLVESEFPNRIPELPFPVDDGYNFSSIAAEIHSENQTLFSAAEIDSLVSVAGSSSRRRNDASSDLDNEDLRASRRRRLG